MRRTPWFDRCLDWIFAAYTHATASEEVRNYLLRRPELDDMLVKIIVQIRTRVAHDVQLEAKVVNFGDDGEYLEVMVRQTPALPSLGAVIQEIWDEQLITFADQPGWIALIAEEPSLNSVPLPAPQPLKTASLLPAWAGAN